MQKRLGRIMMLLVLGAVLAACDTVVDLDQHVTIRQNERWDATMLMSIGAQNLSLIGGEAVVSQEIEKSVAIWRSQGAPVDWPSRNEGERHIYEPAVSGQGYDLLNQLVFDGHATISSSDVGEETLVSFILPAFATVNLGGQYSPILEGGRILDTNGRRAENTVEWADPTSSLSVLQAELVPKSSPNTLGLGLVALGLVLLIIAGWLALRRPASPPPPPHLFCPHCHELLPIDARFCGHCGKSVSN